jgi:hypothetical protein
MLRSAIGIHERKPRNVNSIMIKHESLFALVGSLVILILISATIPLPSSAQSALRWSQPQRIRGISDDSDTPYLVADQNRTVHAFFSQQIGSDLAVFYNQWTPTGGWTVPVDILLSPNAHRATVLGAFLDRTGVMHVIFFGGTELGAEIYYSQAPAVNAGQARAWSSPKIVADHAGKLASGALVGDDKGDLFIVYSGNGEGNGLYEVHSTDSGKTWSDPTTVFLTQSVNLWVFAIQAILDSQGQLHVVWTVDNKQGNGDAVDYARLDSNRNEWWPPITLQTRTECLYEADWANITSYKGDLFAIYDCGAPPQRWMRRSHDGGKTWTSPIAAINSLIGENGYPVFLVDSKNTLYVILANRNNDSSIYGMFLSTWMGDKWSEPQPIVSGPATQDFNPTHPQAIISQGNVLLVTWRTDASATVNGIWYSQSTLNAPGLPRVTLPMPMVTPAATPIPTIAEYQITPSPTYSPVRVITPISGSNPFMSVENNPNFGILVAILPVVLLVSLLVGIRSLRSSG